MIDPVTGTIPSPNPPMSPPPTATIMLYKIPVGESGMARTSDLTEITKDTTLQFSKEWFARAMVDDVLHAEFAEFIAGELCTENLAFYRELAILEDLLASHTPTSSITDAAAYEAARSAGSTQTLARFLRSTTTITSSSDPSTITSQQTTVTPQPSTNQSNVVTALLSTLPPIPTTNVPVNLIPKFVDFYKTFFVNGSVQEVNIPSSVHKKVAATLSDAVSAIGSRNQSGVTPVTPITPLTNITLPSNVFDLAANEVLMMLYSDTFKRFVHVRPKLIAANAANAAANAPPPTKPQDDDLVSGPEAFFYLAMAVQQRESQVSLNNKDEKNSSSKGLFGLGGKKGEKENREKEKEKEKEREKDDDESTKEGKEKRRPFWKRGGGGNGANSNGTNSVIGSGRGSPSDSPASSRRNSVSSMNSPAVVNGGHANIAYNDPNVVGNGNGSGFGAATAQANGGGEATGGVKLTRSKSSNSFSSNNPTTRDRANSQLSSKSSGTLISAAPPVPPVPADYRRSGIKINGTGIPSGNNSDSGSTGSEPNDEEGPSAGLMKSGSRSKFSLFAKKG
ncbi:hypothetical protein HDU76_011686 [Blyttiomyces sp. JEL0837]|nr:hypothetical protein HDU76_011686 [Blyttiomyces sp. JEL0837]